MQTDHSMIRFAIILEILATPTEKKVFNGRKIIKRFYDLNLKGLSKRHPNLESKLNDFLCNF